MLLPATPAFTMSGFEPVTPRRIYPKATPAPTEEVRHGRSDGPPDVRLLGGYFVFDSPDAAMLVSILPAMVHVRGRCRVVEGPGEGAAWGPTCGQSRSSVVIRSVRLHKLTESRPILASEC